ncbi:hypothetical protein V8E51_018757 [Hyaloscypha variabilis]
MAEDFVELGIEGCLIDILTRTPTFLVVEGMNVEEGTEVPKMEKVIPNEDWRRRRSEGLVRRSSSQPGNFREDDRERETRAAPRRRRRRSLSDERRPNETKAGSRRGSWHEKGPPPSKTDAVSLTLLGIAAASLAASGVMTVIKHRDRTKELQENTKGRERNGKDRGEDSKASKREGSSGGRRDKPAEGRRTKGGGGRR